MPDQLYHRVAKLAHSNPELRKHLVPLLRKHADSALTGNTFEGPNIRFHAFRTAYRVWDLTNAGKRGKTVDVFALYHIDDVRDEALGDDIIRFGFRLKNMRYDAALAMAQQLVSRSKALGEPLDLEVHQEKGIAVMPAGYEPIEIRTGDVFIEATYDSFVIRDRMDKNNLPVCIPAAKGGKASVPAFYRWIKDNMAKVQNLRFYQILELMQKEGIKYHTYCAMD